MYKICRIFYYYFNKRLILKKNNEYKTYLIYYDTDFDYSEEEEEKYFYFDDENLCIDYDKLLEKNSGDFYISEYPNDLLNEEINLINKTFYTNLDTKMLFFIQKIGETFPSIENYDYFKNLNCPKDEFNNLYKLLEEVDKIKLNEYYLEVYNNILKLKENILYCLSN